MNGSTALYMNIKQPRKEARAGNPFQEIEKSNCEKGTFAALYRNSVQYYILQTFDAWDEVISARLRQLIEAIMPELHQKPYLMMVRLLSKNNLFWMLFGEKARYRIVRNRREGTWALELFQKKTYSSMIPNTLVKVRFVLDDHSHPVGFHLCRGSDNLMFSTDSLSEDELTCSLTCHFSRLSCGRNLEDDLKYLKFLHDSAMISNMEYVAERRSLLSPRASTQLYILPARRAHEVIKKEARLRLLFSVFCIASVAAILLCAKIYSSGAAASPSVAQRGDLLKPGF